MLVFVAAGGATVLACARDDTARDRGALAQDPTAIPVASTPTLVPPRPDQVTPFSTSDNPPANQRAVLPTAKELFTGADGKYQSIEKDGCVWREDKRAAPSGQTGESVFLLNTCAHDIVVEYQPDTGEIKVWAID